MPASTFIRVAAAPQDPHSYAKIIKNTSHMRKFALSQQM